MKIMEFYVGLLIYFILKYLMLYFVVVKFDELSISLALIYDYLFRNFDN